MIKKLKWYLKYFIKRTVECLDLEYNTYKMIGVFLHGPSNDDFYGEIIWNKHYKPLKEYIKNKDTVLELGPGGCNTSVKMAGRFGFKNCILVDREMILDQFEKVNINYIYHTNGLESLKKIKTESVDYVFSNSVLQHVIESEVEPILKELRRISRIGAIQSHEIDFLDMVDRGREQLLHIPSSSRMYTNRICSERWKTMFYNNGFDIVLVETIDTEKDYNSRFILKCI